MTVCNVFAGGTLDRASERRGDRDWIARMRDDPQSRYVVLWRDRCLAVAEEPARPCYLSLAAARDLGLDGAPAIFLGLDGAVAYFAIDAGEQAPEAADDPINGALAGRGALLDLRAAGRLMAASDAAMLAHARALMYWHARHRYCGACGGPTEVREAGHQRLCVDPACGLQHFPRTDPAVIMLVHDGDRCLMGRQASWPEGQYSVLAGFVEPGESLEEAVAREVAEEVGVAIADARYHSSQPWPFPASIMLGFQARATTTELRIDHAEIEDARWISRADLRDPPEGFRLPNAQSISRRLVEDWLAGRM